MNGEEALPFFIQDVKTFWMRGSRRSAPKVLDIGCGGNVKPMLHLPRMKAAGLDVIGLDMDSRAATIHSSFEDFDCEDEVFDGVWASHMLEHVTDPGAFLRKCRRICRVGGVFGVTVPPASASGRWLVPGHLTLWTPALLCYNMIVAGWDLAEARMGSYGKNISVVTARVDAELPPLRSCRGDIELLARFFPRPVEHGCDAELRNCRWLNT